MSTTDWIGWVLFCLLGFGLGAMLVGPFCLRPSGLTGWQLLCYRLRGQR